MGSINPETSASDGVNKSIDAGSLGTNKFSVHQPSSDSFNFKELHVDSFEIGSGSDCTAEADGPVKLSDVSFSAGCETVLEFTVLSTAPNHFVQLDLDLDAFSVVAFNQDDPKVNQGFDEVSLELSSTADDGEAELLWRPNAEKKSSCNCCKPTPAEEFTKKNCNFD